MIDFSFLLIVIQSAVLITLVPGLFAKVYFTFSLIFFGVIPYLEFINEITYWGFPKITDSSYLITNSCLIVANIVFTIFYFTSSLFRRNINILKDFKENKNSKKISFFRIFIISSVSCFIFIYFNDFNIQNLFFRSGLSTNFKLSQTESLVLDSIRLVPFACFMIYFAHINKFSFRVFILLFLVLVCTFPSSIPRFQAAAIYLTIATFFSPRIIYGIKIPLLIIFSLLTIFPFLDQFRSYDSGLVGDPINLNFIFSGHFDSYQSLANVIQHNSITYGYQLLGPLLFFIPRYLWDDKPIGSGHFMAKSFNFEFTNISSNIYAEGYINFGFYGIFIFAALLGYLFGRASRQLNNPRLSLLNKFTLHYIAFYSFYILRGDLMSSVAYLAGFLTILFFLKVALVNP